MIKSLKHHLEQSLEPAQRPLLLTAIVSMLMAFVMGYIATIDTRYLLDHVSQLGIPGLTTDLRIRLDIEIALEAIKVLLDVYLLVVSVVIGVVALYHLATHRRDLPEGWEFAAGLFLTHSMVGLRTWLLAIVLLRLGARLAQDAVGIDHENGLDPVFLAVVMVLVGSALYLSHRRGLVER